MANTITENRTGAFTVKTGDNTYAKVWLESIIEQIKVNTAVAGHGKGETLLAVLQTIWDKAQNGGVTSVKVGSGDAETGAVTVTLAKLGTVAVTADQVALITTNKNGLASLKSDVETNYAKKSDITAMFRYKGTKATQAELPGSGNQTGDVWYVTEKDTEFVWKGSEWEEFGPAIDLSPYAQTSWTTQQIEAAKTALNQLIAANASEISKIKDGTTKVGKAGTADSLSASRTFSITGDASGSTSSDLSGNVTVSVTLKDSGVAAGNYSSVQVDAKGRVTGGGKIVAVADSIDDGTLSDLATNGIAIVGTD